MKVQDLDEIMTRLIRLATAASENCITGHNLPIWGSYKKDAEMTITTEMLKAAARVADEGLEP